MRLFGHTFTSGIIERLRGVVAVEPDVSRSALSRRLCDWLDWRGANGRVQEVSGRKALVELERRGLIELPPVRGCPPRGCPAAAELPWEAPRFSGPLAAVGPVELVAVADRLLDVLTRPIQIGDQEHRVGVTIGLAAARAGEGDADEVVARADQALVSAKADAKGTWRAAPELAPG